MPGEEVEVLYDFDYDTNEGKHIKIHKGEIFKLLEKSTGEWWKVRKGGKEKFFVPANYVKIINYLSNETDHSVKQSSTSTLAIKSDIPSYLQNGSTESNFDSESNQSSSDKVVQDEEVQYANAAMLNLNVQPSEQATAYQHSPSSLDSSESATYANLPTLQDSVAQNKSPTHDPWEIHKDEESGKSYYYNPVTKESSWDSPDPKQKRDQSGESTRSPFNRIARVTSFRKGWTEAITDDGIKTYVHNATGEKWHMAVDASGKEYYYKENSQESLWELPEIDDWPLVPTITNTDRFMVPPNVRCTAQHHHTKEEPAQRLNQPVPQPRRASIDVVPKSSSSSLLSKSLPSYFQKSRKASLPTINISSNALNHHNGVGVLNMSVGGYSMRSAVQSSHSFDKEKKGYLHYTKANDGKKKVKKNWSTAFVVASNCTLLIYKDEKQAKGDFNQNEPDTTIDLSRSTVDWSTKDRSNRKGVLEVVYEDGTCYLLQHDDNIVIHQWYTVILTKVKKFNPNVASDDLPSPESQENNNNTEKLSGANPKLRKHSRRFTRHGAAKSVYTVQEDNEEFQVPPNTGLAGEVAKTSIKEKLRSFLTRRPTQESLEQQGIYKAENMFGSRLQFICDREQNSVPKFVTRCIMTIENKGLNHDGLYRINGNQAQIQKLRFNVDSTYDYDLANYDVHVLTGALKLFFRELKEPLIPFQLYNVLSNIIRDKDKTSKARNMKLQLATMPTVNLDTLRYLFAHLVRVHEHVEENRMRTQNIAIVFGPTLMWPEKESSAIAVNMMCQNSIVEYILVNFDHLF